MDRFTAHPVLGFYGPDSRMWRINREAVLLGAGPAALLLQIAHPLIAEGVARHSDYPADPFGRLRRTLRTTLAMVFGDGLEAERAVARLNRVHATVRGDVADPAALEATGAGTYRALDPGLLLWVQATLIVMSVRAFDAWVGPLDTADREAFWREARVVGQRLGIPERASPSSWMELETWFDAQLRPGGPIVVTPTARRLAADIVRPPIPLVPGPLIDLAALPGLALLPQRIREDFGIPWSARRALLARLLSSGLRAWVRVVPRSWRAMPHARAAERRTATVASGRPARSGNGSWSKAANTDTQPPPSAGP
jgi:uncharacterized protein (DUF2236 family)